jgi:hypothetical protein
MLTMNVNTDIAEALKKFYALEPRQFPFIVALAMNRTMKVIKQLERDAMVKAFDRPTPFTLNGLQTNIAKKEKLEASIGLREFAGKGTPASKYLAPEIYGGQRPLKRMEKALQAIGVMPAGMYAVPAKGAPLNAYGNLTGGYIVKVLSALRAFSEVGYKANRTAASAKRAKGKQKQFFAVTDPARGLPLGVYERKAKAIHMVIAYVPKAVYDKRLPFFEVAEKNAKDLLPYALQQAAKQALATSRSGARLSDFSDALGLF